jgi:signal transduction histidine kinase
MALPMPAIMKTTAARLSALFLLLFALCAILLVFYMTSLSVRMLTTQTQETINEEVLSLGRAYQRGGLPTLVRVVEQRARQPGANLYLLADANGQILTGNVESLEPGVLETEGWTTRSFYYRRYGETEAERQRAENGQNETQRAQVRGHDALALVLRLPNQMILLVGRDLGEPQRFREVVNHSLMLALGMMGIGGIVIWFFVGRAALKRIDGISAASRRIMGGDLSGRLPTTGAGDEFDRLSENLNAMLTRIDTLNEGLKQVSDNIAHDLKTPLTRIRNRAEATLAGKQKPADYRAALEATIAESDHDRCGPRGSRPRCRRALRASCRGQRRYAGSRADGGDDHQRQPRTDRSGAVQHRRQRHQIFGGCRCRPARERQARTRRWRDPAFGDGQRPWHPRRRRSRARDRAFRAA